MIRALLWYGIAFGVASLAALGSAWAQTEGPRISSTLSIADVLSGVLTLLVMLSFKMRWDDNRVIADMRITLAALEERSKTFATREEVSAMAVTVRHDARNIITPLVGGLELRVRDLESHRGSGT